MCADRSESSETGLGAFGTVKFALRVHDCTIEVNSQLPQGPILPATLLPILQGLSNSLTDIAVTRAGIVGRHLSCRKGCGACCRQAVPITPVEARMISGLIESLPEERRNMVRERFRQAAERLEQSGMAQKFRSSPDLTDRAALHALGLRYFALAIPCPFLEEESCSIHEHRPLRCREYLVVSPAEECARPDGGQVVGIKPAVKLSQILGQWTTSGDAQQHELIIMTMLDEWIAGHPSCQDLAHRSAPELLHEFLTSFARDSAAGSEDSGTAETLGL
jgi:Fe-S-cluster containining protein